LITMTILAEPTLNMTAGIHPAAPTTPAANQPRQPSAAVPAVAPARRSQLLDPQASTEQLLRQRDDLQTNQLDRARLRARAIEQNLPLANRLARRYAGRGELLDDLAQVAALALIRAVDSYDPSRHIPFAAYAVPSILGALRRHFRDTAWAIRVPRSTQELAQNVAGATGQLSQRHGRPPTPAELAAHLLVSVDELRAAIDAWHVYRLASLDAPQASGVGADRIDLIGSTDPRYADVDDHLTLRPLVAALPTREQRILTMRFYDHMTQTQIAAEIGLSQMHVSRLLKQTLTQLRAAMPA
jgi:RNA polymerase sigma-B factor